MSDTPTTAADVLRAASNNGHLKAPIKRPWCSDPKPMTRERILELAAKKGEFTVHRYLYRAESLRKACGKMVTAGLLKRAGQQGDFLVFKLADRAIAETPNA